MQTKRYYSPEPTVYRRIQTALFERFLFVVICHCLSRGKHRFSCVKKVFGRDRTGGIEISLHNIISQNFLKIPFNSLYWSLRFQSLITYVSIPVEAASKASGRTANDTGWGWRLGADGFIAANGLRASRDDTASVSPTLRLPSTKGLGRMDSKMVTDRKLMPTTVSFSLVY